MLGSEMCCGLDNRLLLKTMFHFYNAGLYIFATIYGNELVKGLADLKTDENMVYTMVHYPAFFATHWNLGFQLFFLILAAIHDVLQWFEAHETVCAKRIAKCRDVVFTSLVVPYTAFVFVVFWLAYAVNRELVFPLVFSKVVPDWFNHILHTNIIGVVLMETMLQSHRWPVSQKFCLGLSVLGSVGYTTTYFTVKSITGRYLYNLYVNLTWWQIVFLQIAVLIIYHGSYFVQFPLSRFIFGPVKIRDPNQYQRNANFTFEYDRKGSKADVERNGVPTGRKASGIFNQGFEDDKGSSSKVGEHEMSNKERVLNTVEENYGKVGVGGQDENAEEKVR